MLQNQDCGFIDAVYTSTRRAASSEQAVALRLAIATDPWRHATLNCVEDQNGRPIASQRNWTSGLAPLNAVYACFEKSADVI